MVLSGGPGSIVACQLGLEATPKHTLLPAGKAELRTHLQARSGKPFVERIADFHLLLYLAQQPSFDATGATRLGGPGMGCVVVVGV